MQLIQYLLISPTDLMKEEEKISYTIIIIALLCNNVLCFMVWIVTIIM